MTIPRSKTVDYAKIQESYKNGDRIDDIAQYYGISASHVYAIVRDKTGYYVENNNNNNNNNKMFDNSVKRLNGKILKTWSPEKFNKAIFKLLKLKQYEVANILMDVRDLIIKS